MLSLLGVLVVIVGFALKMEPIAIIVVSAIVTAICGGINVVDLLTTIGSTFSANRNMLVPLIVMLLVGTMERNGLKEAGVSLIRKAKGLSSGLIISAYGVLRSIFTAFNVPVGGITTYVRPILMPMTVGAVESKGLTVAPEHEEMMKGLYGKSENMANFFSQLLFVSNAAVLLIQSTISSIGTEVDVMDIARVQIPVMIFSIIVNVSHTLIVDKKVSQRCYPSPGNTVKK